MRRRDNRRVAYYVDLFSSETYGEFSRSSRETSGFRERQRRAAARLRPDDVLVCYVTVVSRWVGLLEVVDGPFLDRHADPFVVRFQVRPVVWRRLEDGVPMRDPEVWKTLSFTRDLAPGSSAWAHKVRGSLTQLADADGEFLENRLRMRT